jgi:ankyrin repeat protein
MTGQQLWAAACDGDEGKVSTLLSTQDAQSFINYHDVLWVTSLYIAAQIGHDAVLTQLIAARCNVDLALKTYGATPLHCAAGQGHVAVTKQLIEARCSVDLQTSDGLTPLHIAAAGGCDAVT